MAKASQAGRVAELERRVALLELFVDSEHRERRG
jgi:hypothetical protein